MSVLFKKELYADPSKPNAEKMYYPRLLTLGQSARIDAIAWKIKERSSLSKGEILSVLTNFVEIMRESLFDGQTVNIANFGVFSLSCQSEGAPTEKDCTSAKIKQVRINFRPSTTIKIDTKSTRAGDKIEFVDLQTYLNSLKQGGTTEPGGENPGGGGGVIDPEA